jgi:hypothetical protein
VLSVEASQESLTTPSSVASALTLLGAVGATVSAFIPTDWLAGVRIPPPLPPVEVLDGGGDEWDGEGVGEGGLLPGAGGAGGGAGLAVTVTVLEIAVESEGLEQVSL